MGKYTQMRKQYAINKEAKVGDKLVCPSCGSEFIKTHYAQAFCKTKGGTKCKDYYWNNVTPTKRNNTTRISPANAAWQEKIREEREYFDDYDPGDNEYWDNKDFY